MKAKVVVKDLENTLSKKGVPENRQDNAPDLYDIIQDARSYPMLQVEWIVVVYVIRLLYDVYHLFLKEFI
jgi:hypothetical protein